MKSFTILFILIPSFIIAQNWVDQMQDPNNNFYDTQKTFNDFWENKTIEKGKGWKQFKRWENFIKPRVFPDGTQSPDILMKEYNNLINTNASLLINSTNVWSQVGPNNVPLQSDGVKRGIGRVNTIAFHPTDSDKIYIGAPSGGFWKSDNGGLTWSTTTDFLTNLGVSDIAINPNNPNIIYIITGDRDAGDTYSYGLMKSTDGGNTFNTTGLSFNVTSYYKGNRVLIDPSNPNTIIVATSNGIYRSVNSGISFDHTFANINITDIEFHPTNMNIIYGASQGNASIYKSNDNGLNWNQAGSGLPPVGDVERACIAVTDDNSQVVYALFGNNNYGFYGVYKSFDEGLTWSQQSNSPNLLGWEFDGSDNGGQAWYDLALSVSPNDENLIFVGGINCWKSTNSGQDWNINTHWYGANGSTYMHADEHMLRYNPLNNFLYSANDGGLYYSNNNGDNWLDISDGLHITQFYSLGVSQTVQDKVITGAQDNGTFLKDNSNWDAIIGGDGMECIIDYTNSNIMYGETQYGGIRKSTNGGYSFTSISPTNNDGAWETPYEIDPNNPNIIYAGYDELYKSYDRGNSWNTITNGLTNGGNIDEIGLSKSNSDVLYITDDNDIFRTSDAGLNWTQINTGLPNKYITYVIVNPNDANSVWVTFSGYTATEKVYKSNDGGNNWVNISGTLPNIPVNCIELDKTDSLETIYIGTDLGVFYSNSTMNDWNLFNNNTLPNVIVNELEIQYQSNTLFAATYGRGLWSFDLEITSPPNADFSYSDSILCNVPSDITFINNSYYADSYYWDFGDGNTSTDINPTHTYTSYGIFSVQLIASSSLGVDTIFKQHIININQNNYCITQLPVSGAGITQTQCVGTIYDVGGPNSSYYNNTDSWITIEPPGSSQITLTFNSFDIEAPSSSSYCNWDYLEIFDGPDLLSPSLGQFCNSLTGSPGSIVSSGGAITILLHSDQSVVGSGFDADWSCAAPVSGCTDSLALNYDASANIDNGSCTYCNNDTNYTNLTSCDSVLWNGNWYNTSGTYDTSFNLSNQWNLYYNENCEGSIGSEWNTTSTINYNSTNTIGNISNNTINLNINNILNHDSIRIEFDLYLLDSWDGNFIGNEGPDDWYLVFNSDTLINTRFKNTDNNTSGNNYSQCFPDNCPANNPRYTGSYNSNMPASTGNCNGNDAISSMYKISRDIYNNQNFIDLKFIAAGLQQICDESWAIDNINIYYKNSFACDSTVYLNLTVDNNTSNTTTLNQCLSYTWPVNGQTYTTSGTYSDVTTNANGCTNTEILNLTINNNTSNTTTLNQCLSYTWPVNGQTYTTSGTYTDISTNASGCTHTETLVLSINNSTSNTTTLTDCDSYTWAVNGTAYTSSGTYTDISTNASGCTHTETLVLSINNSTSNTTTVTDCDSYTWAVNGTAYTSSGTYTDISTNSSGCTHTETLVLTINNTSSSIANVTSCDSYIWNGITYNISGTYTYNATNSNGCDSIVTLNLIINYASSSNNNVTSCDLYSWNGVTYNASGVYTYTTINSMGCDSIAELDLEIGYSVSSTITINSCDSFLWNNNIYSSSGTYTWIGTSSSGCDIISTLNLIVDNSNTGNSSIVACDSYTWDGLTYTNSGIYSKTYTNILGCDSTHTLDLSITSISNTTTINSCDSFTWLVNGLTYNYSGVYIDTSINSAGCIQIETLYLTILNSSIYSSYQTTCDSYLWSVNGASYTQSGIYTDTILDSLGCNNIFILDLIINSSSSINNVITACDSYTWNGISYNVSGQYYSNIYTNILGCDSRDTLNLTILNSISSSNSVTACDYYIWNGVSYSSSGIYTNIYTNSAGCDSIHILDLTISNSTIGSTTAIACDNYIWNGVSYSSSGIYTNIYTNSAGCDSIHTLNLTINNSSIGSTSSIACNSYTWDGAVYNSSGSYTNFYTNSIGCDSSHILDLIINDSYVINNSIDICKGENIIVGDNTYYLTGTYIDLFTSVNGCDSLVNTSLTVSSYIITISSFQVGNDILTSISGGFPSYTYEWSTGEITDQITPLFDGSYWVIITDINGCVSDTSFINVDWLSTGVDDFNIDRLIIYPNPSRDIFNIQFTSLLRQDLDIRISNMLGEVVFIDELKNFNGNYNNSININNNSKGVYLFEIQTNKGIINKKLILH